MHPDLHRYLDGEIPREALAPELRAELEAWEALESAARELGSETAPRWLESRVMASLVETPATPAWRRLLDWWLQPRPIQVRPVGLAVAAAALALLLVIWPPVRGADPVPADTSAVASEDGPLVYVQFVFVHPDAQSVSVAGDFNGWDTARHLLRDPHGDGVWTGLIEVPAGVHKYMFVVDGEEWVTDPFAERYVDDGFGMRNAVLAVAPPRGGSS